MCGIVGAVARDNVLDILLEGLRRLEYRGYDSAGVAVIGSDHSFARGRAVGKVNALESVLDRGALAGHTGLAHTRWATHGSVTETNAHPHICRDTVAVVCNGIVENHDAMRREQEALGYEFASQTDTEVVVNQVHHHLGQGDDLLKAVQRTAQRLEGAYAFGVMSIQEPDRLVATRNGPPLLVGLGDGEAFIASDASALLAVTRRYMALENGDVVDIHRGEVAVYGADGRPVERKQFTSQLSADAVDPGPYRHFMLKEIFEQPVAITDTLEGRISTEALLEESFGPGPPESLTEPSTSRSSPVAPAIMPAAWPATGSSPTASPATSKWPANSATAAMWFLPTVWWWQSPSPGRRPTPWPRWRRRGRWATAIP